MKRKIFSIFIILISFILVGCSSDSEKLDNNSSSDDRLNSVIRENNYIVVDVRTSEEYSEGHVVGSINIPYDEIDENVELDKSKTILVYCKSGRRSSIAYQTLTDLGYDVLDLGAYESVSLEKE